MTAVRRLQGSRLLDADSIARIEERLDANAQARTLYQALDQLSAKDRALLELVAVTEAAQVLGVKPATARVRLHRCRARVHIHMRPRIEVALAQEVTP